MMALPHFLAGGGEMGALMRAKSWTDTLLGPPATWPEALKMAVGICLNSRFPISLWWGPELVMLYNDAWRPILGKTKHPAGLGRPGIESWPEIWDIIYPQFTSVLTRGEATWSDDLLLVLERNNYREEAYFTYSYSPIKRSDGSIGGVFSAITETTERVLGERRLRTLRELAAQTAESKSVETACEAFARVLGAGNPDLPFAILYLLDEDGTFASRLAKTGIDNAFAPAALRLDHDDPWGVARVIREGDVILLNDLALHFGRLPGGVWPEPTTSAIVLPVAKPGQKGGTAGALVAGINPRRALDDAYRGFFDLVAGHLATAVSNARAYEEERKRAEALAEIDRTKTQFFSNVSHEFRTPLTLMLGPLEEVLAKPETNLLSDDRSLVLLAHRNGVRLLKLVNTLLDFSRIEAGRMQASFQPIDLAVFTAELASNFRSAIERAGLRLVIDCPSLPHQVYVDADMWEKVVLNLISNAFKFTFEGEIGIAAKPSSDGRYAEVVVRDTGTGIPPEELSHLFERFHRVEGARGRTIEGSGIGLALVQELIKLHGGTIRVTSEVGQGSAFTVAIPFGVGHLPADRIGRGRAMATANVRPQAYVEEALGWFPDGGTAAPGPPPPPASDEPGDVSAIAGTEGQLVLVADDNADMRNYVQRLLRAGGFRVEAVTDGKKALAAARRLKPDLVLSDVMMPELDGFGLLTAVRQDPELHDTPVLLLSARAGEEAKVEGLSAGADDYLIKPFSARELLARVGVKLQLARKRRERSERELRQILDLTPLHITEFGPDGSRLYNNQAGLDYHGLTLEEWQRADLQTLCHPHDAERLRREQPHRLLSGSAFEHEMRLKRRDGQYRWFLFRFRPMVDEHGRPTRWYAAATDIEDRKQAEQRLRRSEAYLTEAQRLSRTGSFGWNVSSGEIYWSEETYKIFEFDQAAKLTLESIFRRIHPDDRNRLQQTIDRASEARANLDFEHRLLMPDGSVKHLHVLARLSGTPSDNLEYIGAVTDVTERKRAEEALRRSEQRWQTAFENSAIGMMMRDCSDRFIASNSVFQNMLGYTESELSQLSNEDVTYDEDRRANLDLIRELLEGRRQHFQIEKRYRRKDGTLLWVRNNVALIPGIADAAPFLFAVVEDIAQRKQEESARRYSEERYRIVVETASDAVVSIDESSTILFVNHATSRIFGYDASELIGQPLTTLMPDYMRELHEAGFKRYLDTAERHINWQGTELIALRKNSEVFPVEVSFGELAINGRRLFTGFIRDITERKRAEEALRLSESSLAEAQRLTHTGSWVWELRRDAEHLSEEWYRIYGFDPAEGMPGSEKRLQRVHPEDRAKWQEVIERAIGKKSDYETEYRILLPDGTVKYIHVVGHPVLDSSGEVLQFVGSSTDITERKRAEEKIRQSEKELRQLLDLTPQYLAVFGPDRDLLYVNKAMLDYFGFTLEEWRSSDRRKYYHPDDRERLASEIQSKFLSGLPHEYEARFLRKDGQYRWFLVRWSPLPDEQGRVARWYVVSTDIEDRKQAEQRLQNENVALREEIDKASMFEEIVGISPALHAVLSRVSKVAPTDSTVLVTGETGTGKELVARAIHRRSHRCSRAFVSVNCAAVPRDLIASELFGHEKGAFTGATQRRLGRFELAEGGTIFLDEIGELPAETQIALLRVLQEHELERVGGTGSIRTDVRVIAATNRDLQAAITAGTFRSDLFYRLNVFPIEVPPLRERQEDIPVLVEYFIDRYARKAGKSFQAVDKKSLYLLQAYPWPGNIRELQNVIERSIVVCDTENFSVDESWLSRQPLAEPKAQVELSRKLAAQEKEMIEAALRESRGRVSGPLGAAAKLGLPGSTLDSKIRSLRINKNRFKTADPSTDRT
jgi:PAS domain S-box-containing protein